MDLGTYTLLITVDGRPVPTENINGSATFKVSEIYLQYSKMNNK